MSGLLQGLGDMLIWLGIVVLPFAIPVVIIVAAIAYFKWRKKKTGKPVPTSTTESK